MNLADKEHRDSPNVRGVSVSRVDEHVIRLRHEHRADHHHGAFAFSQPAITPSPRDGEPSRPFGWQLRFVDLLSGYFIRSIQFYESMTIQRLRFPNAPTRTYRATDGTSSRWSSNRSMTAAFIGLSLTKC